MRPKPHFPIEIFYDGSCAVCAAEIEHYLRQDRDGKLIARDISGPHVAPEEYHISLADFRYELHVIDRNGHIYRGVAAFWAIWQAFPNSISYSLMSMIVTAPLLNPLARLLYRGFARIRPYLPKRHSCTSGTCHVDQRH
jgi:predicted DCC family thiol-disulfide oxidoreductase YuxK